MTAIVWDRDEDKSFEAGVDRGVLYTQDRLGVPWNGIVSVEEDASSSVEAVYFDGVKFSDEITPGDFSGSLRAITYPEEFLPFEGIFEDNNGVFIHNQPQDRFHLCWRTGVGNAQGEISHYKIHIAWNLTALPSARSWDSLADDFELVEFEWSIAGIPEPIEGFRPTAHITLDSRRLDPWLLEDIESILYGDDDNDARLPSLKGLTTFIRKWDRLIIRDNGDGTWTAITQDDSLIVDNGDGTFDITTDNIVIVDADSFDISSSDKNEEDIWLQ